MSSPRKRVTQVQKDQRAQEIEVLLDSGAKKSQIAAIIEERFGVSRRHSYRCVEDVEAQRLIDFNESLPNMAADIALKYDFCYRQALQAESRKENPDWEKPPRILDKNATLLKKYDLQGGRPNAAHKSSKDSGESELDLDNAVRALFEGAEKWRGEETTDS